MSNHVAGSSSVCIHSVCVAKSQRRKGIALQLLKEYITRLSTTSARGSPYKRVLLIAHEELRPLYEKAGFTWLGKSDVTHGSRPWYEMRLDLNGKDAAPQIPPDVLQNLLKPSSEKHNPTLVSDCHHGIEDLIMSDSEGTAVNKYDLLCPRGCRSVILKKGVAQWTERTSVMVCHPFVYLHTLAYRALDGTRGKPPFTSHSSTPTSRDSTVVARDTVTHDFREYRVFSSRWVPFDRYA